MRCPAAPRRSRTRTVPRRARRRARAQPRLADVGEDGRAGADLPAPAAARPAPLVGPRRRRRGARRAGRPGGRHDRPPGRGPGLPPGLVQRRTTSAGRRPRRTWPTSRPWGRCRPRCWSGWSRRPDLAVAWALGLADGLAAACAGTGRRRSSAATCPRAPLIVVASPRWATCGPAAGAPVRAPARGHRGAGRAARPVGGRAGAAATPDGATSHRSWWRRTCRPTPPYAGRAGRRAWPARPR